MVRKGFDVDNVLDYCRMVVLFAMAAANRLPLVLGGGPDGSAVLSGKGLDVIPKLLSGPVQVIAGSDGDQRLLGVAKEEVMLYLLEARGLLPEQRAPQAIKGYQSGASAKQLLER